MSLEACPHCHEQVRNDEDGCGTERCMARRVFIRQTALHLRANSGAGNNQSPTIYWTEAKLLWDFKPEGC